MPDRSLADWLALLERRHPQEIDLGLDRVAAVWSRLGGDNSPFAGCRIITVAGTNGKGSTVACIEALAVAHGLTVGAFTSPHILRYNERIRLQGEPVVDALITAAFARIESARGDISLTYFEFNTLAALLIFADEKPAVVVLEVGLGGRLDAVNIIDADVAIVTSIDLDHQGWLGDTREQIAVEKLGIARPGMPLLIGETDYPANFAGQVAATGALALWLGRDFSCVEQCDHLCLQLADAALGSLSLQKTGLLPQNKALAAQALQSAGFTLNAVQLCCALDNAFVTGRQQWRSWQGRNLLFDVAHNPAACRALAQRLESLPGRVVAVASVLSDKDWAGMVAALSAQIGHWYVAEIAGNSRATSGQTLLEVLYNAGLSGVLYSALQVAFEAAIADSEAGDTVVIFGSFFTVAELLALTSVGDASD